MFWTVYHGKVMLFQCLIDVIKTYGGVKVQLHAVLTPALCGGVWSTASPKERAIGIDESVFILVPVGNRTPRPFVACSVLMPVLSCSASPQTAVLLSCDGSGRQGIRTELKISFLFLTFIILLYSCYSSCLILFSRRTYVLSTDSLSLQIC
jgi:hypothetical protein